MDANRVYVRQKQHTKFTSERCGDAQEAMKYFGNYSQEGHTILVVMPTRSSCKPWITIPEGVIAVVTKNGEFLGYWESGFHWCLPWTEATYLVTRQNIVFDMPVTLCPTSDNIFIDIHVSIVFDIQPEHEYVYQLCMNVNELNQMLEAAITERVRNMTRSVSSRQVYSLRGETHAHQMMSHLKSVMANKGVNIKHVIITNVKLPPDVANSLQEKTIFQFKNTLERKKQAFELRTLNDKEELELLRQMRLQERQYEIERAELDQASKQKEIERVKANNKRLQAEMKEKTVAIANQINAETDVKYNEILAEANLIENEILNNARAEAAKIRAEADAFEMKTLTECEKENAEVIAKAIELEGQIEERMLKGAKKVRKHQQIMERLGAMQNLAQKRKMVIYGEQGNNLMANIEAIKLIQNQI